jgi:hypothetical protein
MNTALATLAGRRQYLVERSALCRVHLRQELHAVRGAVSWARVPAALATAPAARTMAWTIAMSLLGTGRAGRVLLLASRALLVGRLACAAVVYVRGRTRSA